ncbi:CusA/CzcA family heavy metal efflux RND transporter, partial [Salmonella sp. 3DZ2-4SM]
IKGQVVIKVSGSDLDVLNQQAQAILGQVRGVEGVESAFIDRDGSLPQLQIEIDRDRAARYGLNVRDVDEVIETALGGRQVGELWEGDRRFPITLRLDDADRDLQRLRTVPVGIGDGHTVTLSDVADFRMASGAINISRENAQRVKAVSIFIAGRDMGSVVADMRKRVDVSVQLPEGYRLEWSGEFENQQRAMKRLGWVIPLSVLIIFVLLFDAFKDISSAALILANVPLAMIG